MQRARTISVIVVSAVALFVFGLWVRNVNEECRLLSVRMSRSESRLASVEERLEGFDARLARLSAGLESLSAPREVDQEASQPGVAGDEVWRDFVSTEIDRLHARLDGLAEPPEARSVQPAVSLERPAPGASRLLAFAASANQSNPNQPGWDAAQTLGAPDTHVAADVPTSWASAEPDGGLEWLELEFAEVVRPDAIRVRETLNPGAVIEVEAADASGRFHSIWRGEDPTRDAPANFDVPYAAGFATQLVRVTLDTRRVPGWNEIDAVGLIVGDQVHWATGVEASSSYSQRSP